MFPHTFYSHFPAFPKRDTCFVIMSFAREFNDRWRNVIAPALSAVAHEGRRLTPYRVDASTIGDSILTEILSHIGSSRLVFADISTVGIIDGRPVRNGNVMYEVGIAHATRLPHEVLLFRSDDDPLLFDVQSVRVNKYNPTRDPESAKDAIVHAANEALREVQLQKHLIVTRITAQLTPHDWVALALATSPKGLQAPSAATYGELVAQIPRRTSVQRLIELEAVVADYAMFTPENTTDLARSPLDSLIVYRITELGRAVLASMSKRMGLHDKVVLGQLNRIMNEGGESRQEDK